MDDVCCQCYIFKGSEEDPLHNLQSSVQNEKSRFFIQNEEFQDRNNKHNIVKQLYSNTNYLQNQNKQTKKDGNSRTLNVGPW